MDENRIEGTIRNTAGKVQEGVGKVTGDTRIRAEGMANQAIGTAQDLYGQTSDAARQTASTLDRWLRTTIETQPYTSPDRAGHRLAAWANAPAFVAELMQVLFGSRR